MPRKVAVVAILLLATGLRLNHIRRLAFENDEIAEARWSSLPFSEMMAKVRNDAVHPPFDYLTQFVAGRIGPDWVRRMPSVIAGVATVALVIALTTTWVSPSAGLAAGFLLAISPMHIYYSQNVRPYSTALFFIAASLYALENRHYVVWSAFVFLAGATLYFAGAIAAMVGLFVIRRPLFFMKHAAVWTLLYSPWFPVIAHASRIPSPGSRERLNWGWWEWRLQSLATGNERTWVPVSAGSWVFWILVAIGVAWSIRLVRLRIAAFMFLTGTALEIVLLQIHPHYSTVRYLMPSWLAAFFLAGAAIDLLLRYWATRPAAAAALIVFSVHSAISIEEILRNHSDWRGVAEYVHDRIQPGDTLVVTNGWVTRNFGYYWEPVNAVNVVIYSKDGKKLEGPAWVVTGGCMPQEATRQIPLMARFNWTDLAEVRYLRAGHSFAKTAEVCPE